MKQKASIIAKFYKLKLLVYFGSYGTKYYGPNSDIDIAYLSEEPLTPQDKMELLKDLIIAHQKSEIDLVDLQTAEPILRFEVAKDGRVLFEKESGVFQHYALFYIKNFWELKPVILEEMRMMMEEIRGLTSDD